MSNLSANSESARDTLSMLATSMTPAAPHLLSRIAHENSPSTLCSEDVRYIGSMSSAKRPKLSLQTSNLTPTFAGADGGRKAILSPHTATPTRLNTFNNSFDLTYRPSPLSSVPSPITQAQLRLTGRTSSPARRKDDTLYNLKLPFGVRPILKNTSLPREPRRPSTCSGSASPRISGRRVFFPALKNVRFRADLEEEIVTKVYVMRHADLTTSEDEIDLSEPEESSCSSTDEGESGKGDRIIRVDEYATRGRRKRKTLTVSESSSCNVDRVREERSRSTSTQRNTRKRRKWEWTINKSAQPSLEVSSGETEGPEESTISNISITGSDQRPVASQETGFGRDAKSRPAARESVTEAVEAVTK
ncbi:hypothetical protein LTS07_005620 [Exophiala sideris]|uniref:Uncharacterized protein n=1 Tax=Exophiala sideris TaxID=1016849 RepID=A0ABR0J8G4_9EURO|nr:hypothetical protein LTS07_005620 [Exophiala sideris]KAK5031664.1 hypothetical protein LTR13_007654 [Exophiala sideris]KAK5058342.1 hypothetical protein LTR69_006747 [Exophiala sideris]KAK5180271.1 hypothetical protein LTR44_007397 [Eurotiomycetes sp. CCFEE 6388]